MEFPGSSARSRYVYLAKLAEQSERYEDMVEYVESIAVSTPITGDLSYDERLLFSSAFKNFIGPQRESRRILCYIEAKEEGKWSTEQMKTAKSYRQQVEDQIKSACGRGILIVDSQLMPFAASSEAKVFYLKMRGDYYRYLAELKPEEDRKQVTDDTMATYREAQEIAVADLSPVNPIRLVLMLNFSVFHYEILNSTESALKMADQAFNEAVQEFASARETLGEKSFNLTTTILQSLRDNIIIWTAELEEEKTPKE